MNKSIHFLSYKICAFILTAACLPLPAMAGAYDDFFKSAQMDNVDEMSSLLKSGIDPNMVEEHRGETGLIVALREDSMRVFNLLVNAPNINLEAKASNGNNALMMAAFKGNQAAVETLLAKGAAINRPHWSPLHYAAASGSNEIVQLLLNRGANINAVAPNNTTPVMIAAGEGYFQTVKLLLDRGADATLKNDLGMTALDFAEKTGRKDIVDGLTYSLRKSGK